MSDHLPIHRALAAVMSEVTHVGKTGHNKQQGYNFRGIDGVLNAVGPALRKHGVVVLPELVDMSSQGIEVGKNRTLMREVTVRVRYRFVGPAGDELVTEVPGEAMDSGDKAVSKAMSVAMRTALIQALALPTDEPDPDESSYERSAPEPAVPLVDPEVAKGWVELMDSIDDQETRAKVKQRFVREFGKPGQVPAGSEAAVEEWVTAEVSRVQAQPETNAEPDEKPSPDDDERPF